MIEFSINKPDKNKQYTKRPGAYALIENEEGLIAVVKTKKGCFLPGGGIENGETLEQCLKRECLEEIGAEISVFDNFARGNIYFYSTTMNVDMESIGNFFVCKINKFLKIKTEDDHEFAWLDMDQAIKSMYLAHQSEAIRIFKLMMLECPGNVLLISGRN